MPPKVSVVMPIFKHSEEKLTSAIYSILRQTFGDFELIITDGSADNKNSEIVSKIKDKRIRYFKIKGYINCLNFGIEQAKGEYIARMDSDDISYPNRFEEQVRFLDGNPDVALCSTLVEYFGTKNKISSHKYKINLLNLIKKQEFQHIAMMFRKEINLKYENKKPLEDCLLFRKLLLQGYKFEIIDKVLVKYCVSNKSITSKYPEYYAIILSKINVSALVKYYNYNLSFADKIYTKKIFSEEEILEYLSFVIFLKKELKRQKLNYGKICMPYFNYMVSKLKSKSFLVKNIKFYSAFAEYYIKNFFKLKSK